MTESKRHYSLIVIGATFYGCGLSSLNPDALVLEASNHVGSDFVFTFNPGSEWNKNIKLHPYAEDFKDMLIGHEVLRGNLMQCGALGCVFAKWCIDRKINIELMTDVISRDGHKLTVLNSAGRMVYTADRIVDVRPRNKTIKRITAIVHHPETFIKPCSYGEIAVMPSPFKDESYVLLNASPEMNWTDARQKFHQVWNQRPDVLREWKLVLMGSRFDFQQYANPLMALNAGLNEVSV